MTLNELVAEWNIADASMKAAKENYDKITSQLCQYMLANQIKSDLVNVHGLDYKVTVVQSETIKFDETGLIAAIGKRRFARVADLKINRKKLEAAVTSGEISTDLISSYTVVSKSSPYPKVSKYTGEPE